MNVDPASERKIALTPEDHFQHCVELSRRTGNVDLTPEIWDRARGWHDPDCCTVFAVFRDSHPVNVSRMGYEIRYADLRQGAKSCELCNLYASTVTVVLGTTTCSDNVTLHMRTGWLAERKYDWDCGCFYVTVPHSTTNEYDANLLRELIRYKLMPPWYQPQPSWPVVTFEGSLLQNSGDLIRRCGLAKKIYLRRLSLELPACIVQEHDTCKQLTTSVAKRGLPKRLIHLGDGSNLRVQVIAGKSHDVPYTALSYQWGQGFTCKLEKASLPAYSAEIPWKALPQTYQDAITLTRALGLCYIWIDSLCILQDDEDDFQLESAKMADIYKLAHLVISADCAPDTQAGFLNRENATKLLPSQEKSIDVSVKHHSYGAMELRAWQQTVTNFEDHDDQESLELSGVSGPYHGYELYSDEPICSRAWCFQEYLSATRLIHFTSKEMIWECNQATFCECGYDFFAATRVELYNAVATETQTESSGLNQAAGIVAAAKRPRIAWFKKRAFHTNATARKTKAQLTSVWDHMIEEYSGRQLTCSKDRLLAISGIASYFEQEDCGGYFAGHWRATLPESLGWYIDHSHLQNSTGVQDYTAPSWSWASIQGPAKFEDSWHKLYQAHVSRVTCCVVGSNPYGRVSAGAITLAAAVVEGKLMDLGHPVTRDYSNYPQMPCCSYALVIKEWTNLRMYEVVWIPDTHKFEHENQSVLCVIIAGTGLEGPTSTRDWCRAVVVVPSDSHRNCFERIGFAKITASKWHRSIEARRREITIV